MIVEHILQYFKAATVPGTVSGMQPERGFFGLMKGWGAVYGPVISKWL